MLRPGPAPPLIWWASSVCDGKPAIHTLSLGNRSYGKHAARHFEPVFRAYVEDVTRRRGCTDVRLPDADAFTKSGD